MENVKHVTQKNKKIDGISQMGPHASSEVSQLYKLRVGQNRGKGGGMCIDRGEPLIFLGSHNWN